MGYRLSKIYTKTGDAGTTGLGDGSRVNKDHVRVEAYGTVDELNSAIGCILSHKKMLKPVARLLESIQHELFTLGGELCLPQLTTPLLQAHQVTRLETALDELNRNLPSLKEFILPTGGPATTSCHLARTICRRAERRLVNLMQTEPINPVCLQYLNRLSDLLFVIARFLAKENQESEQYWQKN